jgi:hypothetical protein
VREAAESARYTRARAPPRSWRCVARRRDAGLDASTRVRARIATFEIHDVEAHRYSDAHADASGLCVLDPAPAGSILVQTETFKSAPLSLAGADASSPIDVRLDQATGW